jgi:glycosyltransferase involved in cell wall biosynthesis
MLNKPIISIIIPLLNEEQVIPKLVVRLNALVASFPGILEIILIDDGSKDKTPYLLQQLALTDEHYAAIIFSRNFGHPAAISAGLKAAQATEAVFIIDGDLQDPPELITEFYGKLKAGNDIIYGVRKKRKEHMLKKSAYHIFYRLLNQIAKIDIPLDSGDFCMISRRAVDVLNQMPEESRFLRGMRSWIGFTQVGVEYERDERQAGKSKYSLGKLIQLALNGIFNFSEIPIKLILLIGVAAITIAAGYLGYTLIQKFFFHIAPEGFTGLLFIIVLFSGVQLISLAVIGEYVVRIFFQSKQRPLFIIKNFYRRNNPADGQSIL